MKKLVVEEFVVSEKDYKDGRMLKVGERYSYFQDPETGKFYRPIEGFIVTGDDLTDRFVEVKPV